ncbi:MAG: poly-gamma-glutamate synthase PgsB [Gemmatimonadetes bacterium]|nr:poly-gamma-glutamate synthase PgsB [Gemmatimonadota bacterium]
MSVQPGISALVLLVLVGVAVSIYWRVSLARHQRRLEQLEVRVHVYGVRGKCTVTRLLGAVLREGGFITVSKTTGSAARVIGPAGEETPIRRRGAATINEQVDVVRDHVDPDVEALVIECMAVKPLYQQYSQDFMVRSDITVITNVREDHQEEMGESLEEIADSLSSTIPRGGLLITSEDREHLRERLRRNAQARGSRFVYADPADVTDDEMRGFDYVQFKENVACGLAVARAVGIPREVAIRGMWKAVPDVGAVRLRHYQIRGKDVLWVPLFAANDRESVVLTFQVLQAYYAPEATVIGILNNRWDRGKRAEQFARVAALDLKEWLDHVVTFGGYEQQVADIMTELGFPRDRITRLGESVRPSMDRILDTIADLIPGEQGVLIGMVNIHTPQAELLMEHFAHEGGVSPGAELELSRTPERMPVAVQRYRRALARPPAFRQRNRPDA